MTQGFVSALVVVLAAWLTTASALAERYAVIIGNNEGHQGDELLRWAERDASRTHALLLELGGVEREHASLLLGKSASEARRVLLRLKEQIAAASLHGTSTVFVYYSGHGDAHSLHLGGSSLALGELAALLSNTGATTGITIIDSCRDEPVRRKGARHAPPFDVRVARNRGPNGRVTITSSARNEVAQESDQLRSSFFTHHLLSGMRGAADRDGDREVSLHELYRYAYHHTLASSHARLISIQHPQLELDLEGEGELVITQLSSADGVLVLDEVLAGDCLVIDRETGQIAAQLYKAMGTPARIALPAARYAVQLRDGSSLFTADVGLEWGGTVTVRQASLRRESLAVAARKGAYSVPIARLISAEARVGRAMVADGALVGFAMRGGVERRGVQFAAELASGISQGTSALFVRDYYETRFGIAIGPRWSFAPLAVAAGATLGTLWIHERARRVARDGATMLLGVPSRTSDDALGGYFGAQVSAELALRAGLLLALRGELPVAAIRIDNRFAPRLTASLGVGCVSRF